MDKKLEIIGVAGTNGSGKDSFGHILADHHKYLFVSVTELLRTELKRRGLPIERENLRTVSAEWRRELGLGVLVDKAIAEYEVNSDKYAGIVMASLRNPGEADRIHQYGGTMIWLDANPKVRYDRVQKATDRGRSGEDDKTYEEFIAEEQYEMHAPVGADNAVLDGAAVKAKCDLNIDNTSENLEEFRTDIEKKLSL